MLKSTFLTCKHLNTFYLCMYPFEIESAPIGSQGREGHGGAILRDYEKTTKGLIDRNKEKEAETDSQALYVYFHEDFSPENMNKNPLLLF